VGQLRHKTVPILQETRDFGGLRPVPDLRSDLDYEAASGGGQTAKAMDSKSIARKRLWVRIPPAASKASAPEMRSRDEVGRVLRLHRAGLNNSRIARETGIPRATVSGWVNGRTPTFGRTSGRGNRRQCPRCGDPHEALPGITAYAYAYLLGIYLGDGCLLQHPRGVYRLSVFLDARYPVIIAECEAAMSLVLPASKVVLRMHHDARMISVNSYSKHWLCLFPQHGPGLKHHRQITLEAWQAATRARYPGRLVRGLIHSDGCRVINRIRHSKRTYTYPRYFFSNRSADIQGIFCDACDRLGVGWRQDGPYNISVARAASVAILDRHVGPKR
jgi:hypothetical protein